MLKMYYQTNTTLIECFNQDQVNRALPSSLKYDLALSPSGTPMLFGLFLLWCVKRNYR